MDVYRTPCGSKRLHSSSEPSGQNPGPAITSSTSCHPRVAGLVDEKLLTIGDDRPRAFQNHDRATATRQLAGGSLAISLHLRGVVPVKQAGSFARMWGEQGRRFAIRKELGARIQCIDAIRVQNKRHFDLGSQSLDKTLY